MKKVVVMVIALAGLTAMAQHREKGNYYKERPQYTAEQLASLQTKRMTLTLDLTEVQQNQVQNLNLEQAKMRKAKMEERNARKDAEDSKKPTSQERYAMQMAMLDQKIAHKAEMKKILSAEQYVRWEKMAQRKGKHKRGKGKKGGREKRHSKE